jgi:hypothetical protein
MTIDSAKRGGQRSVAVGDPALAEITHRLVDTYRPERIYLFGLRATHGSATHRTREAGGETEEP